MCPNLAQFGANMGSVWSQNDRLWAHLNPFWIKFGATVGPYIHMSILYSPCSTVYVFLGPYSTVHTSIAHRIFLHKQTRPQQYQLQSLSAVFCESTIASCSLPTVYCHQPAAHRFLLITYCPVPGPAECAERLNPPPLPLGKSWRVESTAEVRMCQSQICRSLTPSKSSPAPPHIPPGRPKTTVPPIFVIFISLGTRRAK